MSMTGELDGGPTRLGIPAGDLVAGMYAVIGILAAYVDRQRTRQGRWMDVAMLDGMLAMLSYQAVYSTVGGTTPGRQGSRHDSIPTYRTFRGGVDRDLAVTANTGVGHPVEEERFATPAARLARREELWPLLQKAFTASAADWVDRLNAADIPAALITTVPEALRDARESGRGMVRRITHPDGRSVESWAIRSRSAASRRRRSLPARPRRRRGRRAHRPARPVRRRHRRAPRERRGRRHVVTEPTAPRPACSWCRWMSTRRTRPRSTAGTGRSISRAHGLSRVRAGRTAPRSGGLGARRPELRAAYLMDSPAVLESADYTRIAGLQ